MRIRNTKTKLAIILSLIISIGVVSPAYAYAETTSDPGDLSNRVIFLDPGHDEETGNYFEDYSEHVTMLVLAEKIKMRLEGLGATVYLTRDSDKRKPSEVRCAFINKCALEAVKEARSYTIACSACIAEINRLISIMQSVIDDPELGEIYMNSPYDPERTIHRDQARILELEDDKEIRSRFLFISLHSNASIQVGNTSDNGACAFYISTEDKDVRTYYDNVSYSSYSEVSNDFGNIILDHIAGTGLENLGSMADNFFMIREHNIPGVLIENGHHTNPGDRAMLQNDDFLETLADAYADAIAEYFSAIPLPARFFEPVVVAAEEEIQEDDTEAPNAENEHEIKRVFLYIA